MRWGFAILLMLGLAACAGEDERVAPAAGEASSAVAVLDAKGLAAELVARKGQPLLVNFWARWCTPCVAELPDLEAVRPLLQEAGGDVLGFTMDLWAPGYELDEARAELPGFLAERGLTFPVFLYGDTDPIPVLEEFGVPGDLPFTMVLDRSGAVVEIHEGQASVEELEALVRRATG
ncbi:MAG: TlpA family protein disulfide reductase [Planctomycetota bacterium]